PPAGNDSMSKAIAAMGLAETALNAVKTTDALPHEMEALNELLKAQAENKRKQVARQQQGGGGGTGNTGSEDLSALFDRELQRQQQTNYENRPSTSQNNTPEKNDALERLRDLARRQDELGRNQQELAKHRDEMTAEELKRQLERLTREQSELRKEAEDL